MEKFIMKNWAKQKILKKFNISFSKAGDDIQLMKLINDTNPGVYMDIGSWHPVKASNTYFFYLRNWKGICIDPNPELIDLYAKIRPNDVFINCAIAEGDLNLQYFMLDDNHSSMNTLNKDFLIKHNLENNIKKTIEVPTYSIKDILDANLKKGERLDFFDVDVEGYDLEVLKTNDWEKYRPKIVVIETDNPLQEDIHSEIVSYLKDQDYKLIGKSNINNDLGNLFLVSNRI